MATPHNHDIQPLPFCAPEVLLKAGWTYSADIWNLGTVVSSQEKHLHTLDLTLSTAMGASWGYNTLWWNGIFPGGAHCANDKTSRTASLGIPEEM